MLLFFLTNFEILEFSFRLSFGGVLLFSIFGFTSLMDFYKWAPKFEIIRGSLGVVFFLIPYHQFLKQEYPLITVYFVFYFFITIGIGFWSKTKKLNRKLAI